MSLVSCLVSCLTSTNFFALRGFLANNKDALSREINIFTDCVLTRYTIKSYQKRASVFQAGSTFPDYGEIRPIAVLILH